jgi:hypothetical protein
MVCLLSKYFCDKMENEMGGACRAYGGEERHIQFFLGIPRGKKQLGRHRRRW